MRLQWQNIKLRREIDQIRLIQYLHCLVVLLCLVIEFGLSRIAWFEALSKFVILIIFYNFLFKTIRLLYYTYWSFSALLALYIANGIFENIGQMGSDRLFYLYLLALGLVSLNAYLLFSPVYFPIINWWVYDFRYRGDLKIKVTQNKQEHEGRLTDLRRSSGCVLLFDTLEEGEIIEIEAQLQLKSIQLKAEIVSKRETIIGRGTAYGVKFLTSSLDEKNEVAQFCREWKDYKHAKQQTKFHRLKKDELERS